MPIESPTQPRSIRRILVVGGGTAGWMSALYLRQRTGCEVTLVESPEVGTIGVGEATIPNLVDFLSNMGIDEDAFMRECQATYKLGIDFRDWIELGESYWHPFGLCGGNIDGLDLFHFWMKRRLEENAEEPYCHYSLQTLLCEHLKAHRPLAEQSVVNNYAFHLNATAFAELLSATARQRGVIHRVDHVSSVNVHPNGLIASVELQSGASLDADLYIDCTGFRGVLIEQTLHDAWVDWSDVLLCDRAVVRRGSRDETMRPYTISTAVESGWIWQIPLVNQTGMGYVYSSSHTSDEHATRTLNQYAGVDLDAEVRQLHMRVGRREHFWRGNCVAIGLAGGFIEPLESTGIFFIQRALEDLVELFPDSRFQSSLVETYNTRLTAAYEETRDFIILHYILSNRDDTTFWRDARAVDLPASLQQTMDFYHVNGRVLESPRNPVFRETNFYHVLLGGGRLPHRYDARADFSSFAAVCNLMQQIRSQNEQLATELPEHFDLMRWLHS